MMPTIFVLVAGFSVATLGPFIGKLKSANNDIDVIQTLPRESRFYTRDYADALYGQAVSHFKKSLSTDRKSSWKVNFVLLYRRNGYDLDRNLIEKFDLEALLVPISVPDPASSGPKRIRDRELVNNLFKLSNEMLRNARHVLRSLSEEVTSRDNKTCVLLPQQNFGRQFNAIKKLVQKSVETEESAKSVANDLRDFERSHLKGDKGRFEGREFVFRTSAKAAARHGIAPQWCTDDHDSRCVMRGRIRFGACYDPKFHYDCDLDHSSKRCFVSCHGKKKVKRGRKHVNIAPNDNIR